MNEESRTRTLMLSSGRKIAFAEYGDPRGAVLFYFHGWPSSRLQGALLDGVGKDRGLRIISPDRPGIGLSDFDPQRRLTDWPGTIVEMAAHLSAERFFVMGVSGGGPYVLACAQAMPERLLGSAVVCGAPPLGVLGTRGLFWAYRVALWAKKWMPFLLGPGLKISAWVTQRKIHEWPQNWLARCYAEEDRRALQDETLHRILMNSGHVALTSPVDAVRLDGQLYESDWGFDLGAIRTPVHFWHGAEDWNIPVSYCEKTAALVPGAKVTITPKDGHYSLPMLRNAEIVEAMMKS